MDGERLLRRYPAIDGHADTLERFREDPAGFFDDRRAGHLDSRRLRETGQNVQVLAIYTSPDRPDLAALQYALESVHAFHALLESRQNAALDPPYRAVLDRRDLREACRRGRYGLLLALEGASPLRGSLKNLDLFARLGVRLLTITHNHDNEAARGCFAEGEPRGLTAFGRELIAAAGERGIAIDIAHANPDTFTDVLRLTRLPVVDSHTGLRAFFKDPDPHLAARLLSDEQLRGLAASGGVACIDFLPGHLAERGDPPRRLTLDDLATVIRHAVDVAGIDHVGLGSDWDGFGGDAVAGLEDASRLPAAIGALLAAGFSETEAAKIAGGNLYRVLSATLPA